MNSSASRRVLFLTAVVAGISLAALPAGAIETAVDDEPGRSSFTVPAAVAVSRPSAAERSDTATVIAERNAQGRPAPRSLAWQNDFAQAVTRVQEAFPDDFADAAIDSEGNSAYIAFASSVPSTLTEVLGPLPVDVEIREGLGWSARALAEYGQEIHYSILADSSIAAHVTTDIDTHEGTIAITVEPPAGAVMDVARADLNRMLPQVAANARDVITSLAESALSRTRVEATASSAEVTVDVTSEIGAGSETVYGGGSLRTCTAGFSVQNGTHAHGIITAGHCSDSQTYFGRSVLTYRSSHAGASGDVQWHSSTETAGAQFYYTSGSTRAITATANPVSGLSVCVYGKTTGNTCDEVYKLNQCNDVYCGLAMTHRHHTDNGDSGGPWFWENTGYGVHQGYKTYLLIARSLFSPIRAGASVLGVTVKLS